MKKNNITVDFLINKMQEAAGIENEEYFQREFKKVLSPKALLILEKMSNAFDAN